MIWLNKGLANWTCKTAFWKSAGNLFLIVDGYEKLLYWSAFPEKQNMRRNNSGDCVCMYQSSSQNYFQIVFRREKQRKIWNSRTNVQSFTPVSAKFLHLAIPCDRMSLWCWIFLTTQPLSSSVSLLASFSNIRGDTYVFQTVEKGRRCAPLTDFSLCDKIGPEWRKYIAKRELSAVICIKMI